jgi:hypothetical protein
LPEGSGFDGKDPCAVCCPGLTRAHECSSTPSAFVCIRCGDGICSDGEGWCNCRDDCPAPTPPPGTPIPN